ncbi:hypothetical protein [Nocardia cyriacigeorgica]|uniref:hypothetical protein n=2 Tax=Nocardia cyriacigeorgica TaxID=135487 RepID=UPI002455873E|nr:hypothetical protein [Nocardia cyriacigeorgica]
MDRLREIEIAVLREVIEAVDARLDTIAHLAVPRSQVYAAIIYAVLSSARSTGHYGAGMLANAPLLDAILAGRPRPPPPGPPLPPPPPPPPPRPPPPPVSSWPPSAPSCSARLLAVARIPAIVVRTDTTSTRHCYRRGRAASGVGGVWKNPAHECHRG